MQVVVVIGATLGLRHPVVNLHHTERKVRLTSGAHAFLLAVQPMGVAPRGRQLADISALRYVGPVVDIEQQSTQFALDALLDEFDRQIR